VSIGCAPCTRAIAEGEDIRAGRWWWNQVIKNAVCTKGKENNNNKANNSREVLVEVTTLNFKL
jgi:3'-phosphoadenosine 5'-phosphosulfate sulfotransferase (PAPS reductase)/FAD synthetase